MRFILSLFLLAALFSQDEMIERWHDYDEIRDQLEAWDAEFGSNSEPYPTYLPGSGILFHYEEIGRSHLDDLPFWAVRLSYNADVEEDEPRFLILGQCHAEETYGIETSMTLIDRLLHPLDNPSMYQNIRAILQSSEIWVVPTYNPEGLRVVFGYEDDDENWIVDNSYRKNKHDIDGDGWFDFNPEGAGNDSDGVDLNRNYSLNWVFGDTLYELDPGGPNPSYFSHFDYYRGEHPFSETEVIAMREFGHAHDFSLSIAYHSSRSGNVSEKVVYSYDWEETGKTSADFDMISELGIHMAGLIPKESGAGTYTPVTSKSRRGNAHDWFYTQTGCVQFLIEQGTMNLHPDNAEMIDDTVDRNLRAVYYMINRGIGYGGPPYGAQGQFYQVKGLITDAETGEPVHARVTIPELNAPVMQPRMTNSFGRYRRILSPGTFTLEIDARGYESQSFSFSPSSSVITEIDAELVPVDEHLLTFTVENEMEPAMAIVTDHLGPDTTLYTGSFQLALPENEYSIRLQSAGSEMLFPRQYDIILTGDMNLIADLKYPGLAFHEDFDSIEDWTSIDGEWTAQMGLLISNTDLVYEDAPISLVYNNLLNLPTADEYALHIDFSYELEWGLDSAFVALASNGFTHAVYWDDQHWTPHNEYHLIDIEDPSMTTLSIGINADETLGYRGLKIESLSLLYEPDGQCPLGDLNYDGYMDIADVTLFVIWIMDYVELNGYERCTGDLSGDDATDVVDIVILIEHILND